ncbi:monovalent cation:H+ antiporter-2, CPA2 family [Dyadobacter soli]|uniref:Monovalent cation:H+ antiporter-2, CPA2 family n=1 Tax=Dyadobacter soli TaxID=659014 RepID=A0A1G7ZMA0_9BACT|nr:monovalent cation:proton antiporter-2 (CPA2) family protein [Dyadobacter soli]SDH09230.1 monovalent cation:H+ antiporter-2, CPA2 family [Dyadobacter soli]
MQQSFFFQAMIYLAAAVVMVPIAKRLGLGSVLGYLVAGVLIGPAGLKFIGMEGQDIMHFAEFGVVMMLFVIGLELEPSRLWRMRKSIAGLGGLQVGVTTVLVTGIAMLFGIGWKEALALGMIIAMSSTAIVMQTLAEKGWLKTVAGQSSFAVLLFQDLAIIPMLALFPLLADHAGTADGHGGGSLVSALPAWQQAIVVLLSVSGIVLTGKYLLRPVFHMMARTGLREMFTATALLLVVGIAVLMTSVGLSPALGAFVAGVVLANSEYRHELESSIDPFKGLLLGLFFISVGSSIDFALVTSKPLLIIGLVAGLMALKMAVLFVLGKIFEVRNAQNFIFSIGLSQIGEFAFVLLSFSVQEGVLGKEISDTMTAVVAISMAMTPLAMMVNEKFILTRFCLVSAGLQTSVRPSDVEEEDNPVIIAGYGHFGNIVGRFLRANGVEATVLDNDSDNVDFLRRVGLKVYYGDATRYELLDIAGAGRAQMIIIAISDEEKRLELIETVKKHFPNLHILVRSTNRNDAYDLMNAGIMHIYRETFDTSLRLGVDALKLLGHRAHEATRMAKTFFIHDERTLKHLSSIRNDEEYIHAARQHIEELEVIMQADREAVNLNALAGWDRKAEAETA